MEIIATIIRQTINNTTIIPSGHITPDIPVVISSNVDLSNTRVSIKNWLVKNSVAATTKIIPVMNFDSILFFWAQKVDYHS